MIHYIARFEGQSTDGVPKKIRAQAHAMRELGVDVRLHVISWKNWARDFDIDVAHHRIMPLNGTWRMRLAYSKLIKKIYTRIFSQLAPGDSMYIRGLLPAVWFRGLLRNSHNKIALEIPSNLVGEALSRRSYATAVMLDIVSRNIDRDVDELIVVTGDLERSLNLGGHRKPLIIGNGIDAVDVKHVLPKLSPRQAITMTCVSNLTRFHAIDRAVIGLAGYSGSRTIVLNILGRGSELENLKQLAQAVKEPSEVHFHGHLDGEALRRIYAVTHMGIGGIGLHRKGMRETCSLKTREYAAMGIPFLYAGYDRDLAEIHDLLMTVPLDDSPIDFEKVVTFVERVYRSDSFQDRIRNVAKENLLWTKKLEPVVRSLSQ